MKVSNTRGPSGPYGVRPASGPGASSAAQPVRGPDAVRPAADSSAVLGIPEAEFTPRVRDAIMKLMAEVEHLRQELSRTQRRLEEIETVADQDALLPVLNRRAFVREMSRVMSFADRYGLPASLIYFDLDSFKAVNDRHGHAGGDAVLAHVAQLLTENVRESDLVGRLGGDEFGIILAKADERVAARKAETLAQLIAGRPLTWEGAEIAVACTHGVYTFQPGENAAEAMAKADRAMYARKRGGR